jgi:uncharacterized protein YkwD
LRTSSTKADRRRPAIRLAALTCALTLACSGAAAADDAPAGAPAPATTAPASSASTFLDAMLRELNRTRARFGLPAVRADRRMNGGASAHSRDMARRGYFAHGPWNGRVRQAAGGTVNVGEVIGWLSRGNPRGEAASLVRTWLDSPPHRAVMLGRGFRRVGIGRADGTVAGFTAALYTVDFATAR